MFIATLFITAKKVDKKSKCLLIIKWRNKMTFTYQYIKG